MFVTASESGAAPPTARVALVPGGGTTHVPVGDAALRPSTANAMPAWGAGSELGSTTVRPTTTPGPPVASMSAE